jgi:hypothetical protein
MARPRRVGEDAQVSLGRARASSERRDHLGGGGRAISRPRSRAAPEAAAPALRHDCRQGPMGLDDDRAGASVTTRGSVPRGPGDRESDLLVAAVADAPDAPQHGDKEICKLSISSASFIRPLSWEDLLGFDLGAFLLR